MTIRKPGLCAAGGPDRRGAAGTAAAGFMDTQARMAVA